MVGLVDASFTYLYSLNGGAFIDSYTQSSPITINNVRYNINYDIVIIQRSSAGDSDPSDPFTTSIPFPCFLEGTKILKFNPLLNIEQYVPIEKLKKCDFVKTYMNGYKKIVCIGRNKIKNNSKEPDKRNRLHIVSSKNTDNEFGPLYVTGRHCMLYPNLSQKEMDLVKKFMGDIYVTENNYRLPAYLDKNAEEYNTDKELTIWNIALENENKYLNYGIYANGLLVETSSIQYMEERSGMELLD